MLATIVSQDPMYVLFPVSVRAALELRNRYADKGGFAALDGEAAAAGRRASTGRRGKLDYVDPSVATSTDTLTLRARIPNPLLPGAKPGDRATATWWTASSSP